MANSANVYLTSCPSCSPLRGRLLLGDNNGVIKPARGKPSLRNHREFETYLGRYGGLMLYLKEMDETMYGKLCAVCFFIFISEK